MAKVYGRRSDYISRNEIVNRKISKVALGFVFLITGIVVGFIINLVFGDSDTKIIAFAVVSPFYLFISCWLLFNYTKSELTADKFKLGQEGEDSVFNILNQLPEGYIIWRDLKAKYGNVDYVVGRANEVFCIEVKNHKGRISFNGYELLRNGYPFKEGDLLKQATREWSELNELIKTQSFQTVPIISILVFSNKETWVDCNPFKPVKNGIYVLHERMLKEFIEHYHHSPQPINIPSLERTLNSRINL